VGGGCPPLALGGKRRTTAATSSPFAINGGIHAGALRFRLILGGETLSAGQRLASAAAAAALNNREWLIRGEVLAIVD